VCGREGSSIQGVFTITYGNSKRIPNENMRITKQQVLQAYKTWSKSVASSLIIAQDLYLLQKMLPDEWKYVVKGIGNVGETINFDRGGKRNRLPIIFVSGANGSRPYSFMQQNRQIRLDRKFVVAIASGA
jgi:hypothetical protein